MWEVEVLSLVFYFPYKHFQLVGCLVLTEKLLSFCVDFLPRTGCSHAVINWALVYNKY